MRVGITYDLRDDYLREGFGEEETAEFDRIETIEAIDKALINLGFKTDRLGNIKQLTKRLAKGDKWDFVFNIAEGLRGYGREAQIPCLLEAYNIPYTFSDPLVLALTLHKGMTKQIVHYLGVPTPLFAIIEGKIDILKVHLPFPLFAKPVAEGTGKGINPSSKINNREELSSVCENLLSQFNQPVLVETFLPGKELTVGICGTGNEAKAIGVLEVQLNDKAEKEIYSYFNKENYKELVNYKLAQDVMAKRAEQISLIVWRGIGCRDAGRVDLRTDAQGIPHFLEVNPLAGLHPVHSDLPILCNQVGITYNELIERIVRSAMKRAGISYPSLVAKPNGG